MSKSPEVPEELPENLRLKSLLNLLFIQARSIQKVKEKSQNLKKQRACLHIFGWQLCRMSSNALSQALTGQIQSYQETTLYIQIPSPTVQSMHENLFIYFGYHSIHSASNAVDVDSVKDWKDMCEDIAVVKPKKIKVLIETNLSTCLMFSHLCVPHHQTWASLDWLQDLPYSSYRLHVDSCCTPVLFLRCPCG